MANDEKGAAKQVAPGLVIFDFDGVIADSERIAIEELVAEMVIRGAKIDYERACQLFLGASTRAHMDFLSKETGQVCGDDFPEVWHDRLFVRFAKELKPVLGVDKTLDRLDEAKIPYCIGSGGAPNRIAFALDCLGLSERFSHHVFSAEMVKHGKPAPDLFLYAAEQMNVPNEKCVVVEDAVAGVKAAIAAHMKCIGFLGGSHLEADTEGHGTLLLLAGAHKLAKDHSQLQSLFFEAL